MPFQAAVSGTTLCELDTNLYCNLCLAAGALFSAEQDAKGMFVVSTLSAKGVLVTDRSKGKTVTEFMVRGLRPSYPQGQVSSCSSGCKLHHHSNMR